VLSIAPRVAVPDVVGSLLTDATAALAAAGLALAVAGKEESDAAEGSVLSQAPAKGTRVDRGTTVGVVIAVAKPKLVGVPNLVGQTADAAKAALAAVGLVLDVAGQRPVAGAAAGLVLDQNPQAGSSVVVGSPVHVTVSAVDPTVEVPDIRNQTVAAAQALLARVNLGLSQRGTQPSVQPAGLVLTQDPVPGSRAPTGSVVVVVVTAGGLVVVPQLVGMAQGTAVQQLRNLNLQAESEVVVNLLRTPGTVVSQDPGAGTQLPVGSTVSLEVATRIIRPPIDTRIETTPPRVPPVITRPGLGLPPREIP
jgi:serine/threonine-protein kinase